MKILVLGAGGMAGHVITAWLRSRMDAEIVTHARTEAIDERTMMLDLYDRLPELSVNLRAINPDVVVNCVGILPQQCECEPHTAAYLNTFLPHFLASKCKKVVHISTDCVFSGRDAGPFDELSPRTAQNIYGRTKSAGELPPDNIHLIIRTSIIGPELKKGTGLFGWFMRQEHGVGGWSNALWNGVTTIELARFVQFALENNLSGLRHLHASDHVGKYELLCAFREVYEKGIQIDEVLLDQTIDKRLSSRYKYPGWEPKSIREMIEQQRLVYPELVSNITAFMRESKRKKQQ